MLPLPLARRLALGALLGVVGCELSPINPPGGGGGSGGAQSGGEAAGGAAAGGEGGGPLPWQWNLPSVANRAFSDPWPPR